jgi:V/A-type H+-transporting ATPase subunit D
MLSLTQEGYELLDEKRKLLLTELMSLIHIVDNFQRELNEQIKEAYGFLDRAIVVMGERRLQELSFSISIKNSISISQRRLMGVNIPAIDLRILENAPYHSPLGVSFYVDEVILKFKEVLKLIAELAEKKIALMRLAKEVQKTIRKVNALEKIHLPFFRHTIKYISDRLEEEARESFSMLKLIKERKGR